MTIKPQSLLRSFLLMPYIAWIVAFSFAFLVSKLSEIPDLTKAPLELLAGAASFYAVGIILWGIPYTVLALGLLIWSIRKPATIIFKAFVLSPLLLVLLMVIEVALVSFLPPQTVSIESLGDILSSTLIVAIPSLVFGYGFVVTGVVMNAIMRHLKLIKIEAK